MNRSSKLIAAGLALLMGTAVVTVAVSMAQRPTLAALMGVTEDEDFTPDMLYLYIADGQGSTRYDLTQAEEELATLARLFRETVAAPVTYGRVPSYSVGEVRYSIGLSDWNDGKNSVFYPDIIAITQNGKVFSEEGRQYAIDPQVHEQIVAELQRLAGKAEKTWTHEWGA